MAMIPRLEMRQGTALVMTPQLQQAIKLLQLSNVELQEFVEGELERNPLLERRKLGRGQESRKRRRQVLELKVAWRRRKPRWT